MTTSRIAKFVAASAGAAMALSFALPAAAATTAELQAQINALMAQLSALQGGSMSMSFTANLTVGSTGSEVVALQSFLEAKGFLVMPVGVAKGYFGALTKAAVARFQAANSITPAVGYWGPISRGVANNMSGGTTTGGTTTGGTTTGGITTPGAEGTLTVTNSPVSNGTLYEGADMASVLSFKAEASGSDLSIQRVKIDLGTSSTLYRKILSKIYVVDDAGRTLASIDLNSSTVVRNADDEYEITLTGINSIVPKGSTRIYTIKADVQDSISSGDLASYTVTLSENGVRAIDGAGIDQFSPTADTTVTKAITYSASLSESATLAVSTNSTTPLAREVVASTGSNSNEADKVVLLSFDIRAEKDAIEITDLKNFVVTASDSAGAGAGATASTTYLYAGNGVGGQLLGTAAATLSDVDFTDITYTIPAGTTKTFTLAADIRGADQNQVTFSTSFTGNTTNVIAENSEGDTVTTVTGSATGNNILVRNVGPVFSISTPTIVKSSIVQGQNSTSTGNATFNLTITAKGADIIFGSLASTTAVTTGGGPLASNGTGAPDRSFIIYLNGSASNPAVSSSTDFSVPSSGVTTSGNSFTLAKEASITIPVSFTFQGGLINASCTSTCGVTFGNYAVGLERINWVTSVTGPVASTFMSGRTEWRTPTIVLP